MAQCSLFVVFPSLQHSTPEEVFLPSPSRPAAQYPPRQTFPFTMAAWQVRFSNSRKLPYFYNTQTSQSVWDPPAGLSQAQIQALPGARQYLAPAGGAKAPEGQVRASHILAKHMGSRRPSSWRQVCPLVDAKHKASMPVFEEMLTRAG